MRFGSYLREKLAYIFINILSIFMVVTLLVLFNSNTMLIVFITTLMIMSYIVPFLYEFYKKRYFYNSFKDSLDKIDKKYLITEMINSSSFLEGRLLLDYLYEINKCFHEEINNYKYISNELKEYIELWCHEIKTPIATSKLIIENNDSCISNDILEEIERIESYVEQVLYYSRSDTVEKDYIISNVDLNETIDLIIKKNRKDLIGKKIKIEISKLCVVKSDPKWLEFIINQIVVNSIKYLNNKNGVIQIRTKESKNNKVLSIMDNGIGINDDELNKVFDKGFTGSNGRKKYNSTGIGLYLCKKLCNKLGHNIEIKSELNKYTVVEIIFPNSSMIDDIK